MSDNIYDMIDPFTGKPFNPKCYGVITEYPSHSMEPTVYSSIDRLKEEARCIYLLKEFFEKVNAAMVIYRQELKTYEENRSAYIASVEAWEKECVEVRQAWERKNGFVKFFTKPALPAKPVFKEYRPVNPLEWELPVVKFSNGAVEQLKRLKLRKGHWDLNTGIYSYTGTRWDENDRNILGHPRM